MFEESVDSFLARWRSLAAEVEVFSRVENDPLLEFMAGDVILHALERTNPYLPRVGRNRVIIHAVCESVAAGEPPALVEVTGISNIRVTAPVLRAEPPFVVVDAGFPLVVGVLGGFGHLTAGELISFESVPPLQAFVLEETAGTVRTELEL